MDTVESGFRRGFDHGALFVMAVMIGGAGVLEIVEMTRIIRKWRHTKPTDKRKDFYDFMRKTKRGQKLYEFYRAGIQRIEDEKLDLLK